MKAIHSDEEELRAGAAAAFGVLATLADRECIEALVILMRDDRNAMVRRQAALSLGLVGGDVAHVALRRMVARAERMDQPFAMLAGALSGDPEAGPQYLRIFQSNKDPEIRGVSAVCLGILGFRAAAGEIRAVAIQAGDSDLRARCLEALGMLEDQAAVEPVRVMLAEKRDPSLRLEAARCLILLGDPTVFQALVDMARDASGSYVRVTACNLLGVAGDARAVDTLVEFATDRKQQDVVRIHAVAALGNLLDREPIPRLALFAMDDVLPLYDMPLAQVLTLL
jgi:HEAT repeat protein